MARLPRMALPSIPEHIVPRCHDWLTCFLDDQDFAAIRAYLQQRRAYGRDDFRGMVEVRTLRFASVRQAHRPAKSGAKTE